MSTEISIKTAAFDSPKTPYLRWLIDNAETQARSGREVDEAKAVEWYGKAGKLFQKFNRLDDLISVLLSLDGLLWKNRESGK